MRMASEQTLAKLASISCTTHGGSAVRVYASFGAATCGKLCTDMCCAYTLPSQFYTFDMVSTRKAYIVPSFQQFVAISCFPILLSHGSVDNAIIGGWSFGSLFAFHSTLELEACIEGPRVMFALDGRFCSPAKPLSNLGKISSRLCRLLNIHAQVGAEPNETFKMQFVASPTLRFSTLSFHFTCPRESHMMADDAMKGRYALYTGTGCEHRLPDSQHNTVGVDHFWDLARRLRGARNEQDGMPQRDRKDVSDSDTDVLPHDAQNGVRISNGRRRLRRKKTSKKGKLHSCSPCLGHKQKSPWLEQSNTLECNMQSLITCSRVALVEASYMLRRVASALDRLTRKGMIASAKGLQGLHEHADLIDASCTQDLSMPNSRVQNFATLGAECPIGHISSSEGVDVCHSSLMGTASRVFGTPSPRQHIAHKTSYLIC